MMMEASPRTTLEVIQAQVILGALEVLLDGPAGTAQLQASRFRRGPVKVSRVIMIRLGVTGRPVHHQPNPLQLAPGLAQVMLQKDFAPGQTRVPGFPCDRHPAASPPLLLV